MVRLMPKDEKFQELFVDYAQTTLDAARKLEAMVAAARILRAEHAAG